jgi:hypothetical protein
VYRLIQEKAGREDCAHHVHILLCGAQFLLEIGRLHLRERSEQEISWLNKNCAPTLATWKLDCLENFGGC